jgi:histidyl-tRNA synthetase
MPKFFRAPTGTADFLPDDHDFFTFVKKVVRHRFRQAGFRRISLPIFEETEAFERSLGVATGIIQRELYSFEDRHGRSFSLRPEITTSVVRSFIEHEMDQGALPKELYYIERCYRFERPKSRTKREFWQLGGEILGESDPALDAQIIYLGHRILSDLKIRETCELRINTIGSPDDRKKYIDALANFYSGKERSLTPESREKLEQKKYLELLDPKSEDEEILVKMAPKITDFLSPGSREFFDDTLAYLDSFGIEYQIDPTLVRPLEYYSHTTFEFREKVSKEKILLGGRYDDLI